MNVHVFKKISDYQAMLMLYEACDKCTPHYLGEAGEFIEDKDVAVVVYVDCPDCNVLGRIETPR